VLQGSCKGDVHKCKIGLSDSKNETMKDRGKEVSIRLGQNAGVTVLPNEVDSCRRIDTLGPKNWR
jgi:hypothetical protein